MDEHLDDLGGGEIHAVLMTSTLLKGALVWLVADDRVLSQHPHLPRTGWPLVTFSEFARLRGKTCAELQAMGLVKGPTGRVLQ